MSTVAGQGRQAPAAPENLPRPLTSFVGREAELRSLKTVLGSSRMVTLVGAGGSGKSRLAAELARRSLDHWPDGVWWIDLAGTDDVVGTVVATAELPGRGRPIDVVTSWLAMRHALLVLDNCEHLIAASAAFCQAALERCPLLSIMATSREPLGIAGEARWPLTALGDTDALHLFEARARLVRPGFSAKPHADMIARICERLDRLPLAIEMASARLDMMSEGELLENLNDRFRVLASGSRTVPERQQTMTAAIDWSYRLLTEDEARLFRRLAVFQAGFTMEAARAICAATLPILSGLVQKSMVVADSTTERGTRYNLLESHHDFANERLRESGELEATQKKHYDYFSSRTWEPMERANFWHAIGWARDNAQDGGLGLALEIGDADFSDQSRAQALILELLDHSRPSDTLRVKALTMAARLAWRQAGAAASRTLAEAAVSLARKVAEPELLARALNGAGLVYEVAGELDLAGQMYDEALSILGDSSNQTLLADIRNARGLLAITQGDPAGAVEMLSPCVASARGEGDPARTARYLESLASAQLDVGDVDHAAESWNEALSIFRGVNDWFGIVWSLVGLSLIAAARRDDNRALRLAGAADRLSREYSLAVWSFRANQLDSVRRQSRPAWKEGEAMTTAEAIAYALGGHMPAEQTLADGGLLSKREREVVGMVAAGRTNKEIAQHLFIAERTAEGHVERIRNKLGVRSRTEVATWALAHGLKPLDKPPPESKV